MVEGHQLTDDHHRRIWKTQLVRWRVLEPFDLAHDVVAQIADDARVERRQT